MHTQNITATNFRKNCYQLLNQVFNGQTNFQIIKNGVAVAKITKPTGRKIELWEISVETALERLNID